MESDERGSHIRLIVVGLVTILIAALLDAAIEYPRAATALAAWICNSDAPLPAGRSACETGFIVERMLERYQYYLGGVAIAGFLVSLAGIVGRRRSWLSAQAEVFRLGVLLVGLLALGLLVSCTSTSICGLSLTCT